MKNTFGQSVAITLFGESHGQAIGAVLDGLAPESKLMRLISEPDCPYVMQEVISQLREVKLINSNLSVEFTMG